MISPVLIVLILLLSLGSSSAMNRRSTNSDQDSHSTQQQPGSSSTHYNGGTHMSAPMHIYFGPNTNLYLANTMHVIGRREPAASISGLPYPPAAAVSDYAVLSTTTASTTPTILTSTMASTTAIPLTTTTTDSTTIVPSTTAVPSTETTTTASSGNVNVTRENRSPDYSSGSELKKSIDDLRSLMIKMKNANEAQQNMINRIA